MPTTNAPPQAEAGTISYWVPWGAYANAVEAFVRRGLNYNVRLVEEAGLDPDKPPVIWTELLEWHKKLTKFDSAGNLKQIGLDPSNAEARLYATNDGSFLADSWGFDWYDPKTRTFNLNNEMMAEGLDLVDGVRVGARDDHHPLRPAAGH
jgi:ABC-type glycerol-3-phosphate transport system substrate-binding protein